MERTVPFLNACISFVAFIAAFMIVLYMLVSFAAGMFDIALNVLSTAFTDTAERQGIFRAVNADLLYNVAVLVMLMKAYQVLAGFMREKKASIENIVELAIGVILLELIFNGVTYSDHLQVVLATTVTILFATYAFRYHAKNIIDRLAGAARTIESALEPELVEPEMPVVPTRAVRKKIEAKPEPRKVAKVARIARVTKVEKPVVEKARRSVK